MKNIIRCTFALCFFSVFGCASSTQTDGGGGSFSSDGGRDASFDDDGGADAGVVIADYIVLAWNDLGMHCYNNDAADFVILPPYNNIWAQVIKTGREPDFISGGITVSYEMVDNSYSVGKTNFWDYAQQVFGLSSPLPADTGLKGKKLSGQMDWDTDHFVAEGIPATEYNDSTPTTAQPFQQAVITVKSKSTDEKLASATIVVPVSSEIHCDNCHTDTGDATTRYPITPTGKVETNILTLHDYLNNGRYNPALMARRPVLCASCHSSNALGTPGQAGTPSLSGAMHNRHKNLPDITPDTQGCFNCHPGPKTRCLRDVMTEKLGFNCTTCHGDMAKVAQNTSPWLNEPRCDNASCHGSKYAQDRPLYRHSRGHNGIYCEGCHDSPHALAKSREPRDQAKFIALQGTGSYLSDCTVCHRARPSAPFDHQDR